MRISNHWKLAVATFAIIGSCMALDVPQIIQKASARAKINTTLLRNRITMDGNLADSVGSETAAFVGATIYTNPCPITKYPNSAGIYCNNTNYVSLSDASLTNDFSICIWFNFPSISSITAGQIIFADNYPTTPRNTIGIGLGGTTAATNLYVNARLANVGTEGVLVTANPISSNTWFNLVIERSGTNIYFYANNQLYGQIGVGSGVYPLTHFVVGQHYYSGAPHAPTTASFDEFRIYNYALSNADREGLKAGAK